MRKILLLLLISFFYASTFAQLYVGPSATFYMQSGSMVHYDGLTLQPSSPFTLTNTTLQKNTATVSTLTVPHIDRVYRFANVTDSFKGSISFNYTNSELNGISENGLSLGIFNSNSWVNFTPSVRDTSGNVLITNGLTGVRMNELTLVSPLVVPSVIIVSSANSVCPGTFLTFTATPVNGGNNPTFQWKKNGINVGSNSNVYTSNDFSNGDIITCVVTSNNPNALPTNATSNAIAITVKSITTSASSIQVCQNNLPYTWNGLTYTASGIYTKTLVNKAGCDSFAILNLTIKQPTTSTETISSCLSYTWHGTTYSTSGTRTYHTTNTAGCDSAIILVLTINRPTTSTTNMAVCSTNMPYVWNGNTYNIAGTYTYITTNAKGCDSTAILNLAVGTPLSPQLFAQDSTQVCAASYVVSAGAGYNSYLWSTGAITSSVSATTSKWYRCTVTTAGCSATDSIYVLITNPSSIPVPASITAQAIDANICGARRYRYIAPVLPVNATRYNWEFDGILFNSYGTIDSGTVNSRIITVTYSSNAASAIGDSVKLRYNTPCGYGAYKKLKLTNTALLPPLTPASITIQPVDASNCGSRKYRYIAPNLPAGTATNASATGWLWQFVGTLGGFASIDSGTLNSQIVVMRYSSNRSADIGDSVKLFYTSGCGNSPAKAVKLTNVKLNGPVAPSSITIQSVAPNICGGRKYRFIAPDTTAATGSATNGAASGWLWDFVGTFWDNAIVDSGTLNSRVIIIAFSNNGASQTGDSVRLRYTSNCGNGLQKAIKLPITALGAPGIPSGITIQPVVANVCGQRKYRYIAPDLPAGTASSATATGWLWNMPIGILGTSATLDSGTLYGKIIVITFNSNAAAQTGDSIAVKFISNCGNGGWRWVKLSNTILNPPAAPASITIQPLVTNVCGQRKYRYTAPLLPAATTTAGSGTGWVWQMPFGSLGSTGVLDSGTLQSRSIIISYSSNAAAQTGDSIKVLYTSNCGNSLYKAAKLTNTVLNPPATPASITIALVSDVCNARVYRYTAPLLPAATTTVGAATGYDWLLASGPLGLTGTLDSGSLSGRVIKVKYSSNDGALDGDSISVRYNSDCGYGLYKKQKLSNIAKTGCVTFTKSAVENQSKEEDEVIVYPNPSKSAFNLNWKNSKALKISISIFDNFGRRVKTINTISGRNHSFGENLKRGIYLVEVSQGDLKKTIKVVKE